MLDSNSLTTTDPVAQAVAAQIEELGQWIAYAKTCAATGNETELVNALDTIESYKIELAKHNELTSNVMSGLQGSLSLLQDEVASLTEEIAGIEDTIEERAMDLAEAGVELALDNIFESNDSLEQARIDSTARRMLAYSVDEIRDEERRKTETMLREAESIAQHELTYGGPDPVDDYLSDEVEA